MSNIFCVYEGKLEIYKFKNLFLGMPFEVIFEPRLIFNN